MRIAHIKNGIVSSNEHVSKNPWYTNFWQQIKAYKTTQALSFSICFNLDMHKNNKNALYQSKKYNIF